MGTSNHIDLFGGSVKSWTKGVPLDQVTIGQVLDTSKLPFIFKHVALMPDAHLGIGATVGSVVPTKGAIIPAAVGVDIGCGMAAVQLDMNAAQLPDSLAKLRQEIERLIPVGQGKHEHVAPAMANAWEQHLLSRYKRIEDLMGKKLEKADPVRQLATLGGGNHFIEVCVDESDNVWLVLHSGSRGIGNKIGTHFIEIAKEDMRKWMINLPDKDLAYFPEGTDHYDSYMFAVGWAQEYAALNRHLMMNRLLVTLQFEYGKHFQPIKEVISCHHNYVEKENHFGENVWVTRKGAVRAREGDLGIIPGSMGTKSYIVRGRGNPLSFNSCSHGAGRVLSRGKAKATFTVEDHVKATEGVECRKDAGVLDETPGAYKDIDAVMAAQTDLVEIVHTLKQVVCVKG